MPRGRPIKSEIRQRIVEILAALQDTGKSTAYGYGIFKIYRAVYPKATLRVMYYHLRKGTVTGEFKVEKMTQEKGTYSWGDSAAKVYYTLGPNAQPTGDPRVREYLKREVQ